MRTVRVAECPTKSMRHCATITQVRLRFVPICSRVGYFGVLAPALLFKKYRTSPGFNGLVLLMIGIE